MIPIYRKLQLRFRARKPMSPAFVFCVIMGMLAIAITIDAQTPVGNVLPLSGQAPGGAAGGVLSGTYPNPGFADSPSFVTPTLGVATATSINKLTITAPASSAVLTIANGKTFVVSNTISLAGTDAQTYTFPATSATVARTDATNTFTGTQNFSGAIAGSSDINAGISGAMYWASRAQMTSPADGVILARNLAGTAGALLKPAAIQSAGTKFTVAASGCGTISATTGGATAGSFATTLTGSCAAVVTFGDPSTTTSTNGWSCSVNNQTTANLMRQTASSTTTATFTGVTVASDVINFHCFAY